MFIHTLFVVAPNWKESKYPSVYLNGGIPTPQNTPQEKREQTTDTCNMNPQLILLSGKEKDRQKCTY